MVLLMCNCSIGTSERPPLYKKGVAPGPGQYDTRENIGIGTKSRYEVV